VVDVDALAPQHLEDLVAEGVGGHPAHPGDPAAEPGQPDGGVGLGAKRESAHPLRLFSAIGRRLPAFATALGKALLAERSPEQRRPHLPSPLPKLSPGTITDPVLLGRELALTRDRGYAIDNEENTEGIRCWAVTLPRTDPPVDALSISVPVMRLTDKRAGLIATELVRTRDALARRLVARLP
jgi:DNA-binding IclR family transcriptional regulator